MAIVLHLTYHYDSVACNFLSGNSSWHRRRDLISSSQSRNNHRQYFLSSKHRNSGKLPTRAQLLDRLHQAARE
jgi:hypothetical protein